MTVGVRSFQGARLTEARLSLGLFKNALADMIGVTPMAITRYEQGLDHPQSDKLAAMSLQLNFSEEFFCKPVWPEELQIVHWRSRASETKSAREMTEQRMRWLQEIFAFLESEVEFPEYRLPDVQLPDDFRLIKGRDIEQAALQVREEWGLRDQPIPDMVLALENAGIPVVALDIPSDKQDGFFFPSRTLNRGFVGINIHEVSSSRARFDAAHELGHSILHKNITPEIAKNPTFHKILEEQAHRFAGAILFPQSSFLKEVGYVSLDYLSALKRKWGISVAAMIMRAGDLGLIGKEEKAMLYRSMTKRRWRGPLREPFDKEMSLEHPRDAKAGYGSSHRRWYFWKAISFGGFGYPSERN
jgi:Zn-dependent peptidase ImmA (M78 family)/transcriptional regulator with XRE-family HTH domain